MIFGLESPEKQSEHFHSPSLAPEYQETAHFPESLPITTKVFLIAYQDENRRDREAMFSCHFPSCWIDIDHNLSQS